MRFGLVIDDVTALLIAAGKKERLTLPKRSENAPRFLIGETYPVLPPGATEPACHIEILGKQLGKAGDGGLGEAQAEGFRTIDERKTWWVRRHDPAWVYFRENVEAEDGSIDYEPLTDEQHAEQFDAEHSDRPVWVLTFRLNGDVPRLLVAGAGDDDLGYAAAGGLPGEMEAVSEPVQRAITAKAAAGWAALRSDEIGHRRAKAAASRLRKVERQAQAAGVNLDLEFVDLERVLLRMEVKVRPAEAALTGTEAQARETGGAS